MMCSHIWLNYSLWILSLIYNNHLYDSSWLSFCLRVKFKMSLFVAWRGLEPLCPTVLKLVTMHAPGMTGFNQSTSTTDLLAGSFLPLSPDQVNWLLALVVSTTDFYDSMVRQTIPYSLIHLSFPHFWFL